MAKQLHVLSDEQARTAKPGDNLRDGGGLFLRVSAKGSRTWTFRYTAPAGDRAGKQCKLGLGSYPAVSLADARRKAADARANVDRGVDPITKRRERRGAARQEAKAKADAMTLGRYADDVFLPTVLPGFSNPIHQGQWRRTFAVELAELRGRALASITRADVLAVLLPMWAEKQETASRARGRLERLFAHATQNGQFTGDNPASWRQFDQTLTVRKGLARGHHPAVPHDLAAAMIAAIRDKQADSIGALMLEFIALTACRTGEARGATWGELDTARRLWTIPAARMKMRREHVVLLAPRALTVLEEARKRRLAEPKPSDLVFPSPKGEQPLSLNTALKLRRELADAGEDRQGGESEETRERFSVHGWRATFKTWATTETEFPRELVEEALAHAVGGVEGAYLRGPGAVERRRKLMEAWEAHLDGKAPAGANVLPFKAPVAALAEAGAA